MGGLGRWVGWWVGGWEEEGRYLAPELDFGELEDEWEALVPHL